MTLTELISRKKRADALTDEQRKRYATEYADLHDQIQGKLIDIAMACHEYTDTFIQNPEDITALTEAARKLQSEVSA